MWFLVQLAKKSRTVYDDAVVANYVELRNWLRSERWNECVLTGRNAGNRNATQLTQITHCIRTLQAAAHSWAKLLKPAMN